MIGEQVDGIVAAVHNLTVGAVTPQESHSEPWYSRDPATRFVEPRKTDMFEGLHMAKYMVWGTQAIALVEVPLAASRT